MKDYVISNQPALEKLIYFIQAGGPEETEYEEMTKMWDSLVLQPGSSANKENGHHRLVDLFGQDFVQQTIQGFSFRKPHGYSGDYEIIDAIYQQKILSESRFQKWDKYLHWVDAAKAVRNRKDYFIRLVKDRANKLDRPIHLLNVASGPCRDVLELFQEISPEKIRVHCVDLDPNAIQYAKNLLGNLSDNIQFTRSNIFKFDTTEQYDLVWSAGLFDYFNDQDFVKALSKLFSWCAVGGEVVVGNFSVDNPTRSYMEKAYDWFLYHRTEDQLKQLASNVGTEPIQSQVKSESLKVNLFLHVQHECRASCMKCRA
jgi:extracellular factor (EF) 3-hydroxypalmitic acid methyl ester biosynthesis protein